MKSDFQAGVDSIYNACVSAGTTPSAKTPSACATAVGTIKTTQYNAGVTAGKATASYPRMTQRFVERSNSAFTWTVDANAGTHILFYMALSQYPDSTTSTYVNVTNATEITAFRINNGDYPGCRLYKITDTSSSCTITGRARGDYGTPGAAAHVLTDLGDIANLSASDSTNGMYALLFTSLSQYYYSAGSQMYPGANMIEIPGFTITYGNTGTTLVRTVMLIKRPNTGYSWNYTWISKGDYGNKNTGIVYLN